MSAVPHLNAKWMVGQAIHAETIRAFLKAQTATPVEERDPRVVGDGLINTLNNLVRIETIPNLEAALETEKQKILPDRGAITTLTQQLRDLHSRPSLGHDAILASLQ